MIKENMCSVHIKTYRLNFCDYRDCPLQKTVCTSKQSSVVSFNTSYKQLFTFSEIMLLKMSKISIQQLLSQLTGVYLFLADVYTLIFLSLSVLA